MLQSTGAHYGELLETAVNCGWSNYREVLFPRTFKIKLRRRVVEFILCGSSTNKTPSDYRLKKSDIIGNSFDLIDKMIYLKQALEPYALTDKFIISNYIFRGSLTYKSYLMSFVLSHEAVGRHQTVFHRDGDGMNTASSRPASGHQCDCSVRVRSPDRHRDICGSSSRVFGSRD